ncbi:unnamed protein product [Rotaria sp. Silwood2]|nr:unnamed protein product [Rotaria sp. Silwood2]CAF4429761.1 unnamed protein product [Rotaria sp. Silwood2]
MPATKAHQSPKRSKAEICRKAQLSKIKQVHPSNSTRSSLPSAELSNISHLVGIGCAGIAKVFGAMNIAPPPKEDHFEETDKRILLPWINKFQNESIQAASYEAVDEKDGDPTMFTVIGDGMWQKCGFKSIHGMATVLLCATTQKVLDAERLSKKCLVCTGALNFKNENPDLYDEIIHNDDCESNYDGSSGKLGFLY